MRVIILLICMNAILMASIDASSIRGSAKGPGAEILSTIHTLEKTEAIMKKTQAAMQAKIDKLNANMAVGMDKHIDGTNGWLDENKNVKEMIEKSGALESGAAGCKAQCSIYCQDRYIGNNFCGRTCNFKACKFDGGDCTQ